VAFIADLQLPDFTHYSGLETARIEEELRWCVYRPELGCCGNHKKPGVALISFGQHLVPSDLRCSTPNTILTQNSWFSITGITQRPSTVAQAFAWSLLTTLEKHYQRLCLIDVRHTSPYDIEIIHGVTAVAPLYTIAQIVQACCDRYAAKHTRVDKFGGPVLPNPRPA
jgi:hypothetical protein